MGLSPTAAAPTLLRHELGAIRSFRAAVRSKELGTMDQTSRLQGQDRRNEVRAMVEAEPAQTKTQVLLARIAAAALIGLIILGLIWYGFSAETHQRIWRDISERPGGPMTFRFILQPIMSLIAALHDGLKDARTGRSPYFWTLLTEGGERGGRLWEGLISTSRIILLGLVMDGIYQYTVLKTFYPGEMVIIAILLAFIPYLILRGLFCRVTRWWLARRSVDPVS